MLLLVTLSYPTLCDCMDCGPPGSSSMGFPRQEYCSGLPFPSPRGLPDPGIKHASLKLQEDSFTTEPVGKPSVRLGKWQKFVTTEWLTWDVNPSQLIQEPIQRLSPIAAKSLHFPAPFLQLLLNSSSFLPRLASGHEEMPQLWKPGIFLGSEKRLF